VPVGPDFQNVIQMPFVDHAKPFLDFALKWLDNALDERLQGLRFDRRIFVIAPSAALAID
jgi:hypothetical protein